MATNWLEDARIRIGWLGLGLLLMACGPRRPPPPAPYGPVHRPSTTVPRAHPTARPCEPSTTPRFVLTWRSVKGYGRHVSSFEIRGRCALATRYAGPVIGAFRLHLDDARLLAIDRAFPASFQPPRPLRPDLPTTTATLQTATRAARLAYQQPNPALGALQGQIGAIEQALVPYRALALRLLAAPARGGVPATTSVIVHNPGVAPIIVDAASLSVLAVKKPIITPGVTPLPVVPKLVSATLTQANISIAPRASSRVSLVVTIPWSGPTLMAAKYERSGQHQAPAGEVDVPLSGRVQSPEVGIHVAP